MIIVLLGLKAFPQFMQCILLKKKRRKERMPIDVQGAVSQQLTGMWHSGILIKYWPLHLVKMLKNPGYQKVTFH